MLASELIKDLISRVAEYGDVPVVLNEEYGFSSNSAWVGADDNGDTVIVID